MLTAAIVIAGWVAVYISAQRMLKHTCAQLRYEFQERIDSLAANVEARERTAVAGPTAAAAPASALVVPGEVEFLATNAVAPIALQAGATAPQGPEEATPETLAAIGATITAVLGKEVRIRSAKTPQTPSATPNPWARQGRVIVQASHDLRPPRALTTPERHATSSSGGGDLKRSAQ